MASTELMVARPRVDFFGIGAPKSRTTWLARMLDEHPQIALSKEKEPDFFVRQVDYLVDEENPRFLRDWSWYSSLFEHAGDDQLTGEFSSNLMQNADTAPELVARYYPEAKLVATLRDPVKRTYSHFWHMRWDPYRLVRGAPQTFEEAMKDERLLWRSRYATHLESWLKHFPKDQIHVVLDIDWKADPRTAVQDVFRFLGVNDAFEPPSLDGRRNPTRARRGLHRRLYRTAQRIRRIGLGPVVDVAKKAGVQRLVHRVDLKDPGYQPIQPKTAAKLRLQLMPEIDRLEELLGRDLDAWRNPPA